MQTIKIREDWNEDVYSAHGLEDSGIKDQFSLDLYANFRQLLPKSQQEFCRYVQDQSELP